MVLAVPNQETEDRVVRSLVQVRKDTARDVEHGMVLAMELLLGRVEANRIVQRVKDQMGDAYYE